MKYILIGLDISSHQSDELLLYAPLYKSDYIHCNTLEELELIITDVSVPTVIAINLDEDCNDKYEFCTKYSKQENIHIIFLCSRCDPDERVRWLTFGASEYIQKPFRVEELLRRSSAIISNSNVLSIYDDTFFINVNQRVINYNGVRLNTNEKMYGLIEFFVKNPDKIISKEQILSEVFGYDPSMTASRAHAAIKKIREITCPDIIKTVRNHGYIYRNKSGKAD